MKIKEFFFGFCLIRGMLSAQCMMHHTVCFSIGATNGFGQIAGPPPVFSLQGPGTLTQTNTYSVYTNENNKKIAAFLDADMPPGITLQVMLSPPKGARTLGTQTLSAIPIDLVVEISGVHASGLPMVYTFTSDITTRPSSTETRIITYTLIDG